MIYLVRHGQSRHNVENSRVAGIAIDSPLTKRGIRESQDVGIDFHGRSINRIYHSPALRCVDMAKIIARQFVQEPELISDKRLLEMDQGVVVGRLKLSIVLNPPIFISLLRNGKNFAFKDGETFNQVADRMLAALGDINKSEHGDTLVITHGMAMRTILARRHGWSVWRIILTKIKCAQVIKWPM